MAEYVWQHAVEGERDRLRLMSDLLDPAGRFHLLRTGVTAGWHCLKMCASKWRARKDSNLRPPDS
jgi:hypothetical protein